VLTKQKHGRWQAKRYGIKQDHCCKHKPQTHVLQTKQTYAISEEPRSIPSLQTLAAQLIKSGREKFRKTNKPRLTTVIRSEKCVVRRFRRCANITVCRYTNLHSIAYYTTSLRILCRLMLLGYKPVQHVTVLNSVGNCNTVAL
jgi:hypothetical protein